MIELVAGDRIEKLSIRILAGTVVYAHLRDLLVRWDNGEMQTMPRAETQGPSSSPQARKKIAPGL